MTENEKREQAWLISNEGEAIQARLVSTTPAERDRGVHGPIVHAAGMRRTLSAWEGQGFRVGALPIPADTAALIVEARAYGDALQGGEDTNWMQLVGFVDRIADSLESSTREVERLRMALKEKDER